MHLKKLGRYELVRVLGKGAMGVVYEARDPNLDRRVAIKTIMVDDLTPEAAVEYEARFRVEARSAARLQHPNIVAVYDSDRDGDTAFLVMEYVEGDDLKQRLDRGERLALGDALQMVGDLLEALDFAHHQGVIHRDVKPANLLVEPGGRLKLTDFGVARIAGEGTRTQGSMIGTLKYMAPEQVQGLKVDARADLFSAAVVAYQLLTGVRPFDGDNDFSVIQQVLTHHPAPPSALAASLPPPLDAVFARALAKDRDQRYGSAMEFLQALREAIAGSDMTMLPPVAAGARPGPSTLAGRTHTIPGAPITQELELEYWRAVRDSSDAGELQGFLQRFPEGIYADLARRRLDRLAGPEDPDATVLQGAGTRLPQSRSPAQPRTRTQPLAPARAPAEALMEAPARTEAPAPNDATVAVPRAAAASPQAPLSRARSPASRNAAHAGAQRASVRDWLPWALAATVLLVGTALWIRSARSPAVPAATITAQAPAPAGEPASVPSAAPVPLPVVAAAAAAAVQATTPAAGASTAPVASAAAARAASAPRAAASRPLRRASAAAPAPSVAAPAALTPAPSQPSPPSAQAPRPSTPAAAAREAEAANGAPAPGQRPVLVPPAVTCKDKPFLLREFCISSECAKPAYQNFPACVRLREYSKERDDSRRQ